MERTLCVWYPDWALRQLASPDGDDGAPRQAIDDHNTVVAVNDAGLATGVAVGMQRREAEAICPVIETIRYDPGAAAVAFEPVVQGIEQLIPRVEVVSPGLLLAPVRGAVSYYGDEATVVELVDKTLRAVTGDGYRLGLAAGPFAARQAAEQATTADPIVHVQDDAAFLASLDVETVGDADLAATFRWLGITTLGELAELPRPAMMSRFGTAGLEAHRLARGEDRSTRPRIIPADIAVEERFETPLENLEQAAFVGRALANALLTNPLLQGALPHRVTIEVEAADGEIRSRTWRNADPFSETALAERVRWQLSAWLDEIRLGSGPGIHGGVVRIRLTPDDLSDLGRQLALHEDAHSAAEAHRSLVQTQALVGHDRVLQARPQGGRDPVEQVTWHRWGEEPGTVERDPNAPWPGAVPQPAPTLVPPQPQSLEVEWDGGHPVRIRLGSRWVPVLSWAGPWRRIGRWWEGATPINRYQLVTSAGAFLCELDETGRAWLTGVYD